MPKSPVVATALLQRVRAMPLPTKVQQSPPRRSNRGCLHSPLGTKSPVVATALLHSGCECCLFRPRSSSHLRAAATEGAFIPPLGLSLKWFQQHSYSGRERCLFRPRSSSHLRAVATEGVFISPLRLSLQWSPQHSYSAQARGCVELWRVTPVNLSYLFRPSAGSF
jgi:hypothetical protein